MGRLETAVLGKAGLPSGNHCGNSGDLGEDRPVLRELPRRPTDPLGVVGEGTGLRETPGFRLGQLEGGTQWGRKEKDGELGWTCWVEKSGTASAINL